METFGEIEAQLKSQVGVMHRKGGKSKNYKNAKKGLRNYCLR